MKNIKFKIIDHNTIGVSASDLANWAANDKIFLQITSGRVDLVDKDKFIYNESFDTIRTIEEKEIPNDYIPYSHGYYKNAKTMIIQGSYKSIVDYNGPYLKPKFVETDII